MSDLKLILKSIQGSSDMVYLCRWRDSNGMYIDSWHSSVELQTMGYDTTVHKYTTLPKKSFAETAAPCEPLITDMNDLSEEEKDIREQTSTSGESTFSKLVHTLDDTFHEVVDATVHSAEKYLQSPTRMITESLLPEQWTYSVHKQERDDGSSH